MEPTGTTGGEKFVPGYLGPRAQKRSLILWQLPSLPPGQFIEMYVNPQSMRSSQKKVTNSKRVKGGFMMQYWGEELETLLINGST